MSCVRCGQSHSHSGNWMLTCSICVPPRQWHHKCHIPKLSTAELTKLIKASIEGRRENSLETWCCKRCSKKKAVNQSETPSVASGSRPPTTVTGPSSTLVTIPNAPSRPHIPASQPMLARKTASSLVHTAQPSAILSQNRFTNTQYGDPTVEVVDLTSSPPPSSPTRLPHQATQPQAEDTTPRLARAAEPSRPAAPIFHPLPQRPIPHHHLPATCGHQGNPRRTFISHPSRRPISQSSRASSKFSAANSSRLHPSSSMVTPGPETPATSVSPPHPDLSQAAMTEQVRMISKQLRLEGKLKPPPTYRWSLAAKEPAVSNWGSIDIGPSGSTSVIQQTREDVDMNEVHDDSDVDMADPALAHAVVVPPQPKQHTYKKPWPISSIIPNYFVIFRDHEAWNRIKPPPPILEREHRLPRKPTATTKLGKKAKRKKEKELLAYLGP